ncbi:MAG TPA: DUF3040 domain-containing protein [Ilumatobacteraceae bacterium]|nr:DUF3040 domain-containing protein [Ilumatobacteraceae bacterium]
MPLSEDEQRILRQIEEHLQRDPGFGRTLHRKPAPSRRALMMWTLITLVALGLTVAFLSVSPFLSFATFIGAVVCGLFLERQARMVAEAGLNQISGNVRSRFGQPPSGQSSDS